MRSLTIILLASLTACAQLFGINDTTKSTPPGEATLTMTRESVGATVITAPQDISTLMSTFYVPDHFIETQMAPLTAMAVAAEATKTLRVGALVFERHEEDPLVLAEMEPAVRERDLLGPRPEQQ